MGTTPTAGALLRRRPVILGALVVVLAGTGVGVWATTGNAAASASGSGATRLVAASVTTLRQSVTATLGPATIANLSAGVSRQVAAVVVAVGQSVTAGQALTSVNAASLQASGAQARATVASDEARASSDTTSGASAAQQAADAAAVAVAANELTSAQTSLSGATVTSPISGVVAAVSLTPGQHVSGPGGSSGSAATGAGSGSGSGSAGNSQGGQGGGTTGSTGSTAGSSSAQVVVPDTAHWSANAVVDDTQVGLPAVGDQVQVLPDGATTPLYGVISSVGLLARSTSGVASYPLVVTLTGTPSGLQERASAALTLIYRRSLNVLAVPAAAVHTVRDAPTVTVDVNGRRAVRPVSVGQASGGLVPITAGLADGDHVVVTQLRATRARTGTRTTGTGGGVGDATTTVGGSRG